MKQFKKCIATLLAVMMVFTMMPINAQAAVKLSDKKITIAKGEKTTLQVSGTSVKVVWSSSDKKVATVSKKGVVKAKGPGKAVITAKINKKTLKCKVIVTEDTSDDDSNTSGLAEKSVYNAIISMKTKYPEGMNWTNANFYAWKGGGKYYGGYGCAGFAYLLSDAAFGELQSRTHTNWDAIRVGDILRINYDSHSVIVLEVKPSSVIVAEGNYNSSIHWGREIQISELKKTGTYVQTRWPQK